MSARGFVTEYIGNLDGMRIRFAHVAAVAALFAFAACSEEAQDAVQADVESAVTEVSEAVDAASADAGEALARNIATQQGEEQFTNAGHALAGPLTCEATIQDGVTTIAISCTGTTQAGGAAALTGTTSEIPGASVVTLDGTFTGTVDGQVVFTTERLGG